MDRIHVVTISEKSEAQQPSSANSWAQSWPKLIEFFLSNVIKISGLVSLGIGGLIFIIYFWSVGFMPEVDTKMLVTLFAVSALTGSIVFITMSLCLVYPGYIWAQCARQLKPLQSPLWFLFLTAGVILGAILSVVFTSETTIQETIEKKGVISSFKWLWLAFLLVIIMPALRLFPPIERVLEKRNRNRSPQEDLVHAELYIYRPYQTSVGPKMLPVGKQGFVQKLKKIFQKPKVLGCFYLVFLVNIVLIYPMFYFMMKIVLADPYFGKDLKLAGFMFFLVMIDVLAINVRVITLISNHQNHNRAIFLSLIVGMIGFSLVLLILHALPIIPSYVMNIYKFGNIAHASLVLDEMGCTIAANHSLIVRSYTPGFTTQSTSNPKTCFLSNVRIHSRLGNTYYLEASPPEAPHTKSPPIRFTMPGQNVLSWAVKVAE